MKNKMIILLTVLVISVITTTTVSASESSNPPVDDIKEIISDAARKQDIPPEILKAIAAVENNFKQYDAKGNPIISPDGGIGIMQVTPDNIDIQVDLQRLKTDITYNIEVAAKVLKKKKELNFLPELNNGSNQVLENWYFAVMAYNGLSKTNDPNLKEETYQKKV